MIIYQVREQLAHIATRLDTNDADHTRIASALASLTAAVEYNTELIGEPPDPSTGTPGTGLRGHWVTREDHDAATSKIWLAVIGLASTTVATVGGVLVALLS
jgi:hypothetical protein